MPTSRANMSKNERPFVVFLDRKLCGLSDIVVTRCKELLFLPSSIYKIEGLKRQGLRVDGNIFCLSSWDAHGSPEAKYRTFARSDVRRNLLITARLPPTAGKKRDGRASNGWIDEIVRKHATTKVAPFGFALKGSLTICLPTRTTKKLLTMWKCQVTRVCLGWTKINYDTRQTQDWSVNSCHRFRHEKFRPQLCKTHHESSTRTKKYLALLVIV